MTIANIFLRLGNAKTGNLACVLQSASIDRDAFAKEGAALLAWPDNLLWKLVVALSRRHGTF